LLARIIGDRQEKFDQMHSRVFHGVLQVSSDVSTELHRGLAVEPWLKALARWTSSNGLKLNWQRFARVGGQFVSRTLPTL
jgi:hypothetical protein